MQVEIISRKDAIAMGLKRYFTGKPCKNGHITERGTSNKSCRECSNLTTKLWQAANPDIVKQCARNHYENNKEKRYANAKAWAAANPGKVKVRDTNYRRLKRETEAGRPRPDVCEICNRKPTGRGAIHWDHCHATGRFRGWLCQKCNHALGLLDDNPDLLRSLASYLESVL